MEVILKKYKITNNILKQTITSREEDLKPNDVLGWVIFNKCMYIIFYDDQTNKLTKYLLFDAIRKDYKQHENKYYIYVYKKSFTPLTYCYNTEEEQMKFYDLFNQIKEKAINLGQFFI